MTVVCNRETHVWFTAQAGPILQAVLGSPIPPSRKQKPPWHKSPPSHSVSYHPRLLDLPRSSTNPVVTPGDRDAPLGNTVLVVADVHVVLLEPP